MTLLAASLVEPQFLQEFAETRRFTAGRPVGAKATPDGQTVFFLRSKARDASQTVFELDVSTGAVRELLTPDALLQGAEETLSGEERARLERLRVTARGFTSFQLSKDGQLLLVALSGQLYVYSRPTARVTKLNTGGGPCVDPQFSPDGRRVAYVRSDDVYAVELATNTERRITKGGTPLRPHGLAEFVAQEEMGRFSGFWFSPDGQTLAFQETDHTGVEQLTVVDPTHPEREPERFFYPRAGKKNAAVRLGLISVGGGKTTWVQWDQAAFPYLATVRWPKKGALSIVVQNREQTKEQLLAVEPKSGRTTLLLTEEDPTWINLRQEFPLWLADGSGFFWGTERHGGPEVEFRRPDGSLDGPWVKPEAGYAELVGFDNRRRTLFFSGGADPTTMAIYRVVDGGPPERVKLAAEGPALEFGSLSENGEVLISSSMSARSMPVTHVRPADGSLLQLPSVALEPSIALAPQVIKLGGEPGSFAMLFRPREFTAGKKYPVLLDVYGGPRHLQVVQRPDLIAQWLANQGFLVVKIDGRGTPRRGREWERAIKGDFATLIAADQLAGLRELGKVVKELDLDRVAAFGWSFGGYLAALLALKGDGVTLGIAGAPVVDWLDYDSHYTERYLGTPESNPKAYQVSSLLSYAAAAKRPVLLIHGTADDNVYFLHSLKLSDALFRAGKPHSVLPLTNFTHMVPDPLVTERLYERIVAALREGLSSPR